MVKFGQQNYAHILWGAWMQAVGPVLIVLFAFALVHMAGATLYFIVAAPALFLPLGFILVDSAILPRLFAYLAFLLAAVFAALGVIFMLRLALPDAVTAFGGVQALWWLAAAITLIVRSGKIANTVGVSQAR